MPKFDSKAQQVSNEQLKGDYRFEVVAVDTGISQGAKTRGSDVREVKLKFFADEAFTKPVAQWTEDFINYETSLWKWSVFAKCVGVKLTDGEEFDIDASFIGKRGWATCEPKASQSDPSKKYNRVVAFITTKQIAPAVVDEFA